MEEIVHTEKDVRFGFGVPVGMLSYVCNMVWASCRLHISINKLGDRDQFNNMKLVYLNISDKIYLRNIFAIKASYVESGQLLDWGVRTMVRIAHHTATARSWAEGRKAGVSGAAAPPFLCRPPLQLPRPPTMLLVGASTWRPR